MGCFRNSDCWDLANRTYPSLQGHIASSSNNVSAQINSLQNDLDALKIPDDYLGKKVKRELTEIYESFSNDAEAIRSFKSDVDGFILQQVQEHQNHYEEWYYAQKKKKEESGGEDK